MYAVPQFELTALRCFLRRSQNILFVFAVVRVQSLKPLSVNFEIVVAAWSRLQSGVQLAARSLFHSQVIDRAAWLNCWISSWTCCVVIAWPDKHAERLQCSRITLADTVLHEPHTRLDT